MLKSRAESTGVSVITMPKSIDRAWLEQQKRTSATVKNDCCFDFTSTEVIDSAGIAYLRMMHMLYEQSKKRLILRNINQEFLDAIIECPIEPPEMKNSPTALFQGLRDGLVELVNQLVYALSVLAEMLYWGTIGLLKKHEVKRGALGEQMFQLGYKAVGIVALLSFLIGMVLSLQSAIQLRTYGAGIFLAPLIGITMVREMGPLLTAIILAGRTGSATTAEIATMGVNEEIDALKTMGINPIQFVIVPKFWAISATMPLLSIIATTAGILGGFCIAVTYLDLSSGLFFGELSKYLTINDIRAGFVKSLVFSWLIIWIGSFYGLRVRGGAEAVGRETTNSVVTGIFIIIIADALFSFVL